MNSNTKLIDELLKASLKPEIHQHTFVMVKAARALEVLEKQIQDLRLLAATGHGTSSIYHENGEMSDASMQPYIDFLRDDPEEIIEKIKERKLKKLHYETILSGK